LTEGRGLAKVRRVERGAFDDALEGANGNRFVAMEGNDDLAAGRVAPFLVAALLAHQHEPVEAENPNDLPGIADWEVPAHVRATSSTFAPAGRETGDGSNQSSRASLALRTASSSVSPAEAQPGSSGKKAAQRLVSESSSTTNRSFM
jgi:hypothetical protein